jgi:hypothetical protein
MLLSSCSCFISKGGFTPFHIKHPEKGNDATVSIKTKLYDSYTLKMKNENGGTYSGRLCSALYSMHTAHRIVQHILATALPWQLSARPAIMLGRVSILPTRLRAQKQHGNM